MVVQHNLQAMNSNRMLGITQGTLSSSTEKLSSGYKINRAADDAAGLSISEKMRKQIRGLTQASSNAEDGISSVQTAEGALQEVTDMLQRMNELAVQAANGTNSETDRGYIQDEIDQLVTEVDRVSETTKFNETYLLKGDTSANGSKVYTESYKNSYVKASGFAGADTVKFKADYAGTKTLIFANKDSLSKDDGTSVATSVTKGDDVTKFLGAAVAGQTAAQDVGIGTDYTAFTANDDPAEKIKALTSADGIIKSAATQYIWDKNNDQVIKVAAGSDLSSYVTNLVVDPTAGTVSYGEMADGYMLLDDGTGTTEVSVIAAKGEQQLYDAEGNAVSGVALGKYFNEFGVYTNGLYTENTGKSDAEITVGGGVDINDYVNKTATNVAKDLTFTLHVGADSASTNKITTNIQSMSAASLGIDVLKSSNAGIVDSTGSKATDAIDVIADAIQKVSTQKSALGAVQNRLEHTIKNLDNVVENTTSAESQIRDTDMATEMVKYSNANILSQAGQSMLAQANQSNQGVLSLLG